MKHDRSENAASLSLGYKLRMIAGTRAWDFRIGAVAGVSSGVVTWQSLKIRLSADSILVTETVIGAGVLAVVLAALALLVTFFDDHYRQVLQGAPGGVAGALFPYRVVAAVGGLGAALGVVSTLLWPVMSAWQQAVAFGLTTGVATWAVVGTYQLVGLTLFHGISRAELLRGIDEVRIEIERRRRRSA